MLFYLCYYSSILENVYIFETDPTCCDVKYWRNVVMPFRTVFWVTACWLGIEVGIRVTLNSVGVIEGDFLLTFNQLRITVRKKHNPLLSMNTIQNAPISVKRERMQPENESRQ